MANKIKIKRGTTTTPILDTGEIAINFKTKELSVGNSGTNINFVDKVYIDKVKTKANEVDNKLDKSSFNFDNLPDKPNVKNLNYFINNNIYELDKLKLLETTWPYYDGATHPQFYPSVGMKENGEIYFQGLAKIDDTNGQSLDGNMVKFGKIFNFDISKFEGVPMWGTFIGINDDDLNDTYIIPFQVKPTGDILIKNLGQGNKYYSRIDLNGAKVQTSLFGNEKILNHVKEVEETILNRQGIDTKVLFFTDLHHKLYGVGSYRRYEQFKYMNLINQELDIVCNISGGDNITEYETREKAIKTMQDFLVQFDRNKLVYCNGNHDHNVSLGSNIFLHPDHVKPYINNTLSKYGNSNKFYGYTDYAERKLRIIVLDTYEADYTENTINVSNVTNSQLNWIKENALLNCPSDYNIIVVSHVAPTEKVFEDDTVLINRLEIRTLFENFKSGKGEFSSQGPRKLVCWLSGHEHKDKVVTVNGITYVNTILARSEEVKYTPQNGVYTTYSRELGTTYEFAFDIISIDSTNRKAYFDRIGRIGSPLGKTRTITF